MVFIDGPYAQPGQAGIQPDYDFMEQYIREREKQLIAQYIEHIGTVTYTGGV